MSSINGDRRKRGSGENIGSKKIETRRVSACQEYRANRSFRTCQFRLKYIILFNFVTDTLFQNFLPLYTVIKEYCVKSTVNRNTVKCKIWIKRREKKRIARIPSGQISRSEKESGENLWRTRKKRDKKRREGGRGASSYKRCLTRRHGALFVVVVRNRSGRSSSPPDSFFRVAKFYIYLHNRLVVAQVRKPINRNPPGTMAPPGGRGGGSALPRGASLIPK